MSSFLPSRPPLSSPLCSYGRAPPPPSRFDDRDGPRRDDFRRDDRDDRRDDRDDRRGRDDSRDLPVGREDDRHRDGGR